MIKELFIEKDWQREGDRFHHRQVFNNGKIYIYEVDYVDSNHPWYEIFKRKIVPDVVKVDGKLKNGENYHVKYPSNESFGRWAWCCHDIDCIKRAIKNNKKTFDGCLEGIDEWLSEAQKCDTV